MLFRDAAQMAEHVVEQGINGWNQSLAPNTSPMLRGVTPPHTTYISITTLFNGQLKQKSD